ncbi:MAG: hypothetical protein FWD16_06890, partial [Clostridia bacterium]|nr:hypothetical protein [Clostridia bacterium]
MKKTCLAACALCLLLVSAMALGPWALPCSRVQATDGFFGGTGISTDPWIIKTPEQLNLLRNYLGQTGKFFALGDNIDLTDYLKPGGPGYNEGLGWEPIGRGAATGSGSFQGGFEGRGFEITGLWINRPDEDNVGLFGTYYPQPGYVMTVTNSPTMAKDFTVRTSGEGVIGNNNVGIVCGNAGSKNSKIINIKAFGKAAGNERVGGVFGQAGGESVFANLYCETDVYGFRNVGGMIGNAALATVTDCVGRNVRVEGTGGQLGYYATGGLFGWIGGTTVARCMVFGEVKGEVSFGGFSGAIKGYVSQCASFCDVSGYSRGGGFVGEGGHSGNIRDCYAVGTLDCEVYAGGFAAQTGDADYGYGWVERNYCAVKIVDGNGYKKGFCFNADLSDVRNWNNNYFDASMADTDVATMFPTEIAPEKCRLLTSEQMMTQAAFEGFDFSASGPWAIDEGKSLPYFKWQKALALDDEYLMTGFSYDYEGKNTPFTYEGASRIKAIEISGATKTLTFNATRPGADAVSAEQTLPKRDIDYTAHLASVSESGIGTVYALSVKRPSEKPEFTVKREPGESYIGEETKLAIQCASVLPSDTVYAWLATARPQDSTAKVVMQADKSGVIICDKPGVYTVRLTLTDGATGFAELTFTAMSPP